MAKKPINGAKASSRKPRRFAQYRNGKIVIQPPFGTPSVSPEKIEEAVRKVIADRKARGEKV